MFQSSGFFVAKVDGRKAAAVIKYHDIKHHNMIYDTQVTVCHDMYNNNAYCLECYKWLDGRTK